MSKIVQDALFLDFETRNRVDLGVVGLDNYARTAEPILLAWALGKRKTHLWRITDPVIPQELIESLLNPTIPKIAWYAAFERNILKYAWHIDVPIEKWRDPMILARSLSMPGKLSSVCKILKMSAEEAKIEDGERLIELFCMPNGREAEETLFGINSGYEEGIDHPKDWALFEQYCIRDVEVERKIWYAFSALFEPPRYTAFDWSGWFFDQRMNETGMPINLERARKALRLAERFKEESMIELVRVTQLANPNSPKQLMPWLQERGYKWNTLLKSTVEMEMKDPNTKLTAEAKTVINLRLNCSQNSYTKLKGLLNETGPDGFLRHQFMYGGASRTFRWASAGINVQNLPRPIKSVKKNPKRALELMDAEDYDTIKKEFGGVLPFVASCIRMCVEVSHV